MANATPFPTPESYTGFLAREVNIIIPTMPTTQRGVVYEIGAFGFILGITYTEARSPFTIGQLVFVPYTVGAILADFV